MDYCPDTGKRTYSTRWEAQQARDKIGQRLRRGSGKRRRWESKPYQCRHCGLWHMASTSVI